MRVLRWLAAILIGFSNLHVANAEDTLPYRFRPVGLILSVSPDTIVQGIDPNARQMPPQYKTATVLYSKVPWESLASSPGPDAELEAHRDDEAALSGYLMKALRENGFFEKIGARKGDLLLGVSGYRATAMKVPKGKKCGFAKSPEDFFPEGEPLELFVKRGKNFLRLKVRKPKSLRSH